MKKLKDLKITGEELSMGVLIACLVIVAFAMVVRAII